MTLTDRVIIMKNGEIRQIGTPDEIYDDHDNLFVAGFLGTPPMNFLEGSIRNGLFRAEKTLLMRQALMISIMLSLRSDLRISPLAYLMMLNSGQVYSVEPTGESTLIVVEYGDERITIKA